MLNYLFFADTTALILSGLGAYFAYRLWASLGKYGITLWLLLAMVYSSLIRVTFIFKDCGYHWDWLNYSRQYSFPLYVFLTIGLGGLFYQVKNKLEGNGHKGNWLSYLFHRKK
jgi:hypothetical protein